MDIAEVRKWGLEYYLQQQGIPKTVIEQSKCSRTSFLKERNNYYTLKEERLDTLVPVKDIRGISRVSNQSWFDIVNYALQGEHHSKEINISPKKLRNLLSSLEERGLENFKRSLAYPNEIGKSSDIDFDLYKRGNQDYYFLCNQGNHRTTVSKIIGAEQIKAHHVYVYEFDDEKYHSYIQYKKVKKSFHDQLANTEIQVVLSDNLTERVILDVRSFNHRYVRVEDLPDISSPFSLNFNKLPEWFTAVQKIEERLKIIERYRDYYYSRYKWLPLFWLMWKREDFPNDIKWTDQEIGKVLALKYAIEMKNRKLS